MCPFRARALEKDFPDGEQPRQRRPGLKKPKRQMPSCRTQLANLRAPPGRLRPVWPPRPNPQSYTAKPRGRDLNSQSCAPPGAPAPRVASAPQPAKLHGQARGRALNSQSYTARLAGAPPTRKLARPPGRRRPVWPPRPNPQSYIRQSTVLSEVPKGLRCASLGHRPWYAPRVSRCTTSSREVPPSWGKGLGRSEKYSFKKLVDINAGSGNFLSPLSFQF